MPQAINPYVEWLRIDDSAGSPNNYALLGLPLFTTDTSAIQTAADRRLASIAPHCSGPHGQLAKRVRFEIESARDCLLSPQLKAAYDASLGGRQVSSDAPRKGTVPTPSSVSIHKAATQSSAALQKDTGSTSSAVRKRQAVSPTQRPLLVAKRIAEAPATKPASPPSDPDFTAINTHTPRITPDVAPLISLNHRGRSQGHKKKSRRKSPAIQIIGIIGTILPAVILCGVLYWKFGIPSAPAPAGPAQPRPANVFDVAEPVVVQAPARPRKRRAAPEPAPVAVAAVDHRPNSFEPIEAEEEAPVLPVPVAPRVQRQFQPASVPKMVELPRIEELEQGGFQPLFPLQISDGSNCQLTVLNPSKEVLGTTSTFKVEPIKPGGDRYRWAVNLVSNASAVANAAKETIPVAELALGGGHFQFRWLSGGRSAAPQMLRNGLLLLTIDRIEYPVAMRAPLKIGAKPVDLEAGSTMVRLPTEWIPSATELTLEIIDVGGFQDNVEIPRKSVVGTGDELAAVFKGDAPKVEVRIRLTRVGTLSNVKVYPVIVDRDGDLLSLTLDRIATMKRTLPGARRSAQQNLSTNLSKLNSLQSQYSQVSATSDALLNGRKALMLTSLEKDIQKTRVAVGRSQKQIVQAEMRMSVLPEIEAVANQIHGQAVLKYRVCIPVQGRQVEILRVD